MQDLFFFSHSKKNIDHEWIMNEALRLNNLLTIPNKIIDVKEEEHTNTRRVSYYIAVEDCLDAKEWKILASAWTNGLRSSATFTKVCATAKEI